MSVKAQATETPLLTLEFRIAAQPGVDPPDIDERIERLTKRGPAYSSHAAWNWYALHDIAAFAERDAALLASFESDGKAFTDWAEGRAVVGAVHDGAYYILLANTPGKAMIDGEGWGIRHVYRTTDILNRPAIGFEMDEAGAEAMEQLTAPHIGRQMAVLVDGKVITAPTLQMKLSGRGMITGHFSTEDINYLTRGLGAKRDPAGQWIMIGLAGCSALFTVVVVLGAVAFGVMVIRRRQKNDATALD